MKIILTKDVLNLGEEGDVKEVADGYGRNYLLPQKMAVPYNKHSLEIRKQRERTIARHKEENRKAAMDLKSRIEDITITFEVPAGENGKLFGSINNASVELELEKLGINIERKKIEVPDNTIKQTGDYAVKIKLYGNEEAKLEIHVKGKSEQPEEKPAEEIAEEAQTPAVEEQTSADDTESTELENNEEHAAAESQEADEPADSTETME